MNRLHKLRIGSLTHNEAGQLIKRNITDIDTASIGIEADVHAKKFVEQMNGDVTLLDQALLQSHKRGDAEILEQLDRIRDNNYLILNRQFNVYELSDIPAEAAAYQALKPLFDSYKRLHVLNYEAETNAINHLVQELGGVEYAGHVDTLNLNGYVTRLRMSNAEFDTRFSQRGTEMAAAPNYDIKMIRRKMIQNYSNFAAYIVSLSNAADTQFYNSIFEIINTNRKYYSDMLARRQGINNASAVETSAD